MAAGTCEYTGQFKLGYPSYRDAETGKMLVAEPGGTYSIDPVDGVAPVPPPDGRWLTPGSGAGGTSGGPPPPPPAVPAPPAVPELPGGEA